MGEYGDILVQEGSGFDEEKLQQEVSCFSSGLF
jgi:hypothetical protein